MYTQRTHIKKQHEHTLKNRKLGMVHATSANKMNKGTAIYITNQQINIIEKLKDVEEGYIILKTWVTDGRSNTFISL